MSRKYGEAFVQSLLFISAMASILIMLLIFYFLIHESLPALRDLGILSLLFGTKWHPSGSIYGLLPLITASLTITLLALFINIIIGFPLAIYLAELAGPRSKAALKPAIELLAGVPSIVYGFLGVIILVSYLQDSFDMLTGRSILAGSILLGVMFIPYLTTICEDALRAVPGEFK
ncbi:MAG TPA: ABC transporter permease subunit, partial [Methanothrix sp.]|nr:ABC transporter permease subunit [Methanothrix sp.]